MSARLLDFASAWSERRATNSVAPIASHSTTARRAKAPTIRPVRLRGITTGRSGGFGGGRRGGGLRHRLAARRHQAVADAAERLDRRSVLPELPADLRDVDIDGPRL